MISAIGVSYLLQNFATYFTGGLAQAYPSIPWISNKINVFGVETKVISVVTPILTIVLVIALVLFIRFTKIGMAMRAVSKDFETSRLMGIKINSVISMTFIIGSALAVVGSILYFTTYPAITPTAGSMPGLKAFVAAVFGGIGSIPGAVIGALVSLFGWSTISKQLMKVNLPMRLRILNSEKRLASETTRQKLREAINKELYSDSGAFVTQVTKGFSTSFRKHLQSIAQAAEIPIE
jgi:branched-subunit amino acid ABC-type transport system permease component